MYKNDTIATLSLKELLFKYIIAYTTISYINDNNCSWHANCLLISGGFNECSCEKEKRKDNKFYQRR